MIPRRLFWLLDMLVLLMAFLLAYSLTPQVKALLAEGDGLASAWVARHFNPPASATIFPPVTEFFWILLATAPSTVIFSELLGGHRRKGLTFMRTVISGAVAPFLALSLVALGLFAMKEISWSRLFFFLYGTCAAALLVACRLFLLAWWHRQHSAGAYARNVVIIGSKSNLTWLSGLFQKPIVRMEYNLFGYMSLQADQLPLPPNEMTYLGNADQLGALAVHQPIHEVLLVTGIHDGVWLKGIVETCDYFRLSLRRRIDL